MGPLAYVDGQFVPLNEMKVGIQTHALHYGTACFEGIRGYWNEADQQLYVFRMREHYQRLQNSAHTILMKLPHSVDELCDITVELLARQNFKEDVYIRPLLYKSNELLGVRLHGLTDSLVVYAIPFGKYLNTDKGIRCGVSTWRRIDDGAIPARAKITGSYINSALARSEATANGYDEALMLNNEGHVAEGSGENIFLISRGQFITPAVHENILPGITRDALMMIARQELGIETIERAVDRTELYAADEVFLCGTAAEITPVLEVDHRQVGDGQIGPITTKLQKLFFDVVRGERPAYGEWRRAVYAQSGASQKPREVAATKDDNHK